MIVRHFLQWLGNAPAAERADATAALARAYLHSDLTQEDRAAAESALILALDDLSPLVRRSLAQVFAASEEAPPAIILGLAADVPEIAALVLQHSPLLLDADLIERIATGEPTLQVAIAARAALPDAAAASIAEIGSAQACLVLIGNAGAVLTTSSYERMASRFGHLGAVREAMLTRADLPAAIRQSLIAKLSHTLASFVQQCQWLDAARAQRLTREACEKTTVSLAVSSSPAEMRPLVAHLRASGQLNAGLILRALLCGNLAFFEQALAELCELPLRRVAQLVDQSGPGFRALLEKSGLPRSTHPAFREAIEAMREEGFAGTPADEARLRRRMVERVLTRCADGAPGETEGLLVLLRRFATEAAREEARSMCRDLLPPEVALDRGQSGRAAA